MDTKMLGLVFEIFPHNDLFEPTEIEREEREGERDGETER
jgi:hypothetical protein